METRDFPIAVIASLSSGTLLCPSFSDVHEAAQYLMGHPIWTHQFADRHFLGEMRLVLAAQCPGLPTSLPDTHPGNYLEKVADLEKEFGKTVRIRKGSGLTAMLPTDGIPDHLKDKTIIVDP